MPKLDLGAAVRRVVADEVSTRLAPYRELFDRLAELIDRAQAYRASAPPKLELPKLPPPPAFQAVPFPAKPAKPTALPKDIVVRRLPARPARGSGLRRRRAEAPEPPPTPAEPKIVEAVKPLIRRKAKVDGVDGSLPAEPAVNSLDVKVAKRYFVGQSVRYRAADGLITAKIAAIDGATGVLTLTNPKDESKLSIPAGNVFAAV